MKMLVMAILILSLMMGGCAKHPDNISANYTSSYQYQGYSCDQIIREKSLIDNKIANVSKKQKIRNGEDKVVVGIGMLLFWPILFFLLRDDHEVELSRYKGEYDALQSKYIQNNCFE